MAFKKHSWMKYGRTGMKCEIKVFDQDNKKLDFFKFVATDEKSKIHILSTLKRVYGINFTSTIKEKDSINIKKIMKEDLGI